MDYEMKNHQSWSDKISWLNFYEHKINGWKFGLKQGDNILCEMQSGKTAKFEIKEIEYKDDPLDQFFGNVEFKEYV